MIELTVPSFASIREDVVAHFKSARVDWAIVGAITLAALIVRVVRLVEVPPGLHGDEGWTGIRAQDILNGTRIDAFDAVHGLGQPAGMEYLTAAFVAIFGNSVLTIRLPMALLGVATVALTYALVRVTVSRPAAVISALLLAFMGWHIHYSRIALPPVSGPFFEVLTALLLILALRSRHWLLFVLAGLSLGLGVYSYSSYSLFALGVVIFLAYWLVVHPPEERRTTLLGSGIIICVAIIAALPMLYYVNGHRDTYFTYPRDISVFNSEPYQQADGPLGRADVLADAGRDFVKRVIFNPAADHSDGSGMGPMLDVPLSLLLGFGMLYAFWRWRQPVVALSLIMVLLLPWAGILTIGGGIIRRVVGVTPFIAILAALPLAELIRRAERARSVVRGAAYGIAAAAIVSVGVLDLQAYFGDFPDFEAAEYVFVPELVGASRYIDGLPGDPYVYFYSGRWSFNYETRRYLAPDREGEDRSREFGVFTLVADRARDVVFVFLAPYLDQIDDVEEQYPGGTPFDYRKDKKTDWVRAYYLPRPGDGGVPSGPTPTLVPVAATATREAASIGEERDARRVRDVASVRQALEQYRQRHGAYPDNGGAIETLCAYFEIDAGCALRELLSPVPEDPLGDQAVNGYFYTSDGKTYTVFARRESRLFPPCPEHPEHLGGIDSLLCAQGP